MPEELYLDHNLFEGMLHTELSNLASLGKGTFICRRSASDVHAVKHFLGVLIFGSFHDCRDIEN